MPSQTTYQLRFILTRDAELRLTKSQEAESHAKLALSRMTESSLAGHTSANNLLGLTYGRPAALVQQGLKDEAKDALLERVRL
ncbi:MAG: hypothetical protein IPJ49_30765 [Candidatus Obscuribacter sp.]|nr:hypothetical protein [Candidatus Obscuribacter sp.]